MQLRGLVFSIFLGTLMLTPASAQRISADGGNQTFTFLADQYFSDVLFHFSPTLGTQMGLHQYDNELENYSAATVEKQVAALKAYEKKIAAINSAALDAPVAADQAILLNSIRSQLLSLEVIRNWEKNADNYSSGVTSSIFVLMERRRMCDCTPSSNVRSRYRKSSRRRGRT